MAPAQLLLPLIKVTLLTLMFTLGLGLRVESLQLVRQRPWLFVRVLLGTCVLVPLVGLLLLNLPVSQGMTGPSRIALALMAVCPSAPLTLRKAGRQGGSRDLAALLQVLAALAAVVSIPLLADLYTTVFGIDGWDIGPAEVARQVGLSQVLPLLLGLALAHWRPRLADRIDGPFEKASNLLFTLLSLLVLILVAPQLVPFLTTYWLSLPFMVVLVLAALTIGYLLAGDGRRERTTISLVTSMRNPGLALLFAGTYAPDRPTVKLAILVYLLLTILVSIPFLRWLRAQPQQV